jgi:leader peptidase (prepilin peptidase)/N-methyltransferase
MLLEYGWFAYLFVVLFVLGSVAGSFLNVCIYRLPRGRSLLRPPSSCPTCGRRIRLRDNLPLISYWQLRGRCRHCGQPFSMRYFWVELLTALAFAAVFLLEVALDVHYFDPPFSDTRSGNGLYYLQSGQVPPFALQQFLLHAPLLCVLIVAVFCDLEHGRVPRSVTAFGLIVGLLGAALLPWPAPHAEGVYERPQVGEPARPKLGARTGQAPEEGLMPENHPWQSWQHSPRSGYYPWPVWGPPPAWLPEGSWRLGLATGLAGALAGVILMGLTRWLFNLASGTRAVPAGDVTILAVAGAFLGWQPVTVAFAAVLLPALLWAGVRLTVWRRATAQFTPPLPSGRTAPDQSGLGEKDASGITEAPPGPSSSISTTPSAAIAPGGERSPGSLPHLEQGVCFGPWLALAVTAAWLGWAWVGPAVRPVLFNVLKTAVLVGACWAVVLLAGLLVRSLRGPMPDKAPP